MSIISISIKEVGAVGVKPRTVAIVCNDTLEAVMTAGYLPNDSIFSFGPQDMIEILYGTASSTLAILQPTFSNGIITLVSPPIPPSTVDGDFIVLGDVQAGEDGLAGTFISYPTTADKGKLIISATDSTADYDLTLTNDVLGQTAQVVISDPGQATGYLMISQLPVDPGSNLIAFEQTITATALADGPVQIYAGNDAFSRYEILEIQLMAGGTNFSGGGGNRTGVVTDGTTTYTTIPAATMQSLVNARWGSTPVPFPAGSIAVPTIAGGEILFDYAGGTTDYTAGSLVIRGIAQRIADGS